MESREAKEMVCGDDIRLDPVKSLLTIIYATLFFYGASKLPDSGVFDGVAFDSMRRFPEREQAPERRSRPRSGAELKRCGIVRQRR